MSAKYYLQVRMKVRNGKIPEFIGYMEELLPTFRKYDWRLLAAWYGVTGVPDEIFHYWEIPSANSLLDTMVKFTENVTYQKLHALIDSEQQQIVAALPYDPSEGSTSVLVKMKRGVL